MLHFRFEYFFLQEYWVILTRRRLSGKQQDFNDIKNVQSLD